MKTTNWRKFYCKIFVEHTVGFIGSDLTRIYLLALTTLTNFKWICKKEQKKVTTFDSALEVLLFLLLTFWIFWNFTRYNRTRFDKKIINVIAFFFSKPYLNWEYHNVGLPNVWLNKWKGEGRLFLKLNFTIFKNQIKKNANSIALTCIEISV